MAANPPAAILDVDGTLVDSNYQHALAWYRAFALHGITVPVWRCHRAIGMGGDQIVGHLAGEGFDREQGDTVRTQEHAFFAQMIAEVRPFAGARGLVEDLKARGSKVVIASSAKSEDLHRYLDLLDARELVDGWTDSSTVERTKPAPDLVAAALEIAGGGPGVMIGDSTWDVEAAKQLDVPALCVRTGGFGADELLDAGAEAVFASIAELRERLDEPPSGSADAMVLTLARAVHALEVPQPVEPPTPVVPETPSVPANPDPVPTPFPDAPSVPLPDPPGDVPIEPPAPPQTA